MDLDMFPEEHKQSWIRNPKVWATMVIIILLLVLGSSHLSGHLFDSLAAPNGSFECPKYRESYRHVVQKPPFWGVPTDVDPQGFYIFLVDFIDFGGF